MSFALKWGGTVTRRERDARRRWWHVTRHGSAGGTLTVYPESAQSSYGDVHATVADYGALLDGQVAGFAR